MAKEFDYYLINRENNEHHPLLSGIKNSGYRYKNSYIENPEEMGFRLAKPVPRKPKMVDYHSTPYSVVSDKIAGVITKMVANGVQLIPATVTGKNSELYAGYYFVNIFNLLPALDMEKSIYMWNDFLKVANPIEKMVLNIDFLSSVPLKERLIFRLAESPVQQLYHQSVVDAIMATQPEGVSFCHVNDWSMGTPFD